VTLTATVALSSGTATIPFSGNVTFLDGGNAITGCLTAVSVNGATGVATCTATALKAGSHSIVATYANDTNYGGATSNAFVQTVALANSTIAVTSSLTPSGVNNSVTFTATVSAPAGATIPLAATGKVSFTDNGNAISACPEQAIASGNTATATCTTTALSGGSHSIVATYTGDSNYNGANNNMTQTVTSANSTVSFISSSTANTSTVNQPVTLTATVGPASSSVGLSGVVTFTDNGGSVAGCVVNWSASTMRSTSLMLRPRGKLFTTWCWTMPLRSMRNRPR